MLNLEEPDRTKSNRILSANYTSRPNNPDKYCDWALRQWILEVDSFELLSSFCKASISLGKEDTSSLNSAMIVFLPEPNKQNPVTNKVMWKKKGEW